MALFSALLVLALIPSVSVATVTARAAAGGFWQGTLATAGIVSGDILFIVLAVYGLAWLADSLDQYFAIVMLLGGTYLLWLGWSLLHAVVVKDDTPHGTASQSRSSFMAGLLITIGDQKAIFFYLGFFPAFMDLERMTHADTLLVVVTASVAVGGAKLVYAWLADRASVLAGRARLASVLNRIAAVVMLAVGAILIATALRDWLA